MSRKLLDTYPVFTITVGTPGRAYETRHMTPEQAEEARAEFAEILADLKAQTRRQYDLDCKMVESAVCEHCRWAWTEAGADYNGGCCSKDEANSPQRLACLRTLIDEVEAGDFYRWDADRGRDRTKVDWPWALACAVDAWLKAGRPAADVERLMSIARRVKSSDWCTVWSDPGPSGCSLARRPDEITRDGRPEELADELLSLVDDMGLLPARQAVA